MPVHSRVSGSGAAGRKGTMRSHSKSLLFGDFLGLGGVDTARESSRAEIVTPGMCTGGFIGLCLRVLCWLLYLWHL